MALQELIVPALLAGGGYLLKRSANEKADRKRENILARMRALNEDATQQRVANVEQTVQQYAPEARIPAYEQQAQRAVRSATADVTAPSAVPIGPQYGGRKSQVFTDASVKRARDDLQYATTLARLMGRARAPAELAFEEGVTNTDAALERARMDQNLQGQLGAEQLRLGSVAPHTGKMLAGDVLTFGGMASYPDPYRGLLDAWSGLQQPQPEQVAPGAAAARMRPGTTASGTNGRRG